MPLSWNPTSKVDDAGSMARRTASDKIKPGDIVTIEATVTRVSTDGAEVTVRLPLYGTPVTLPINAVTRGERSEPEGQGEFVKPRYPKGVKRSSMSKALGDD
mgnify:CR=1 FL=1